MDTSEGSGEPQAGNRVLTVPNAISAFRILMIPVFCALIVDPDTTKSGIVLFALVVATDWVDGTVARRTGQVSEVGRILDPVADRTAIAAGLIALVVRGVFPLWAAVLILARDVAVLVIGAVVLSRYKVRLDVRWIGKVATFSLMIAIPAISWGTLDLPLSPAATVVGWAAFVTGIIEYYVAAAVYWHDVRGVVHRA